MTRLFHFGVTASRARMLTADAARNSHAMRGDVARVGAHSPPANGFCQRFGELIETARLL